MILPKGCDRLLSKIKIKLKKQKALHNVRLSQYYK